ncbi:unnamed protein product [Triticum turgidum subsp. durum]|uniref:DUF1618 domain-containing protein n=1 Tax=Triticum turgidum subsp. durum TaxID=4567 RepID=A0A9R0QUC3_TRITD|nr:unnamed protein product [Triticum turgidum subsp. durum]
MASTSTTLPDWLMLDRFVFWSENFTFPKDADSTLATGTNSMDKKFQICFKLVEPPEVSRLFLQMDEGLSQSHSFDIIAAHRAAVLLQMSYPILVPGYENIIPMIDYFLYYTAGGGSPPSLQRLPPLDGTIAQVQDQIKASADVMTNQFLRRLKCLDLGVLCRGEDEVAVAQLEITESGAPPKLQVLCPSISRSWEVKHPPIVPCDDVKEFDLEEVFKNFDAHTVIPFKSYLCWVDYSFGILFCDVFNESPKLLYLELPAKLPILWAGHKGRAWVEAYHTVGVTAGEVMKFVKVVDGNDEFFETTEPASDDFTITSWALITESNSVMKWKQDASIRSSEIGFGGLTHLPRTPLEYPVISMYEPSIIYFMIGHDQASYMYNKVWIVAIDISNGKVKSSSAYINGTEQVGDLCADEALYFAKEKPQVYSTFLPAEFSKHLNLLGKDWSSPRWVRSSYRYCST